MWTLVLILAVNGGLLSSDKVAMTTIPGFTTKENCEAAADSLAKYNVKDQAGFITKCVEVK